MTGAGKNAGPTAMQWSAVKAVQTLMGNARTVPGLPWTGVLPSYTGYVRCARACMYPLSRDSVEHHECGVPHVFLQFYTKNEMISLFPNISF